MLTRTKLCWSPGDRRSRRSVVHRESTGTWSPEELAHPSGCPAPRRASWETPGPANHGARLSNEVWRSWVICEFCVDWNRNHRQFWDGTDSTKLLYHLDFPKDDSSKTIHKNDSFRKRSRGRNGVKKPNWRGSYTVDKRKRVLRNSFFDLFFEWSSLGIVLSLEE